MKQVILLVGTLLVSSFCFAQVQSASNATQLKDLGNAWKSYRSIHANPDNNDITMGYGGQDVSGRPTLVSRTTTA